MYKNQSVLTVVGLEGGREEGRGAKPRADNLHDHGIRHSLASVMLHKWVTYVINYFFVVYE